MGDREKTEVEKTAQEALFQAKNALVKTLDSHKNRMNIGFETYDKLYTAVAKEIGQLRVILEGVAAREKERVWVKNQTHGELDDNRLVDGATGEQTIYKIRGNLDPRLRFVMDVSSSMSKFNGSDRRLDRMAATCVMIMESFHGFEHKYDYSIVGQDGESAVIPFVEWSKPPKSKKERLQIIEMMYWNATFCTSGDHTLAAAHHAIRNVISEEGDDYFVFILSDANLSFYGITDKTLASVLLVDKRVNTYAIFIAGEKTAASLTKSLPLGHGYVCLDTSKLPKIFKEIFATALVRELGSKL